MSKLYRAAERPDASTGAHFTDEVESACAYLDNSGFGGSRLFEYEVDVELGDAGVADARDLRPRAAKEKLAAALGVADPREQAEEWQADGYDWVFQVLENDPSVEPSLRANGYEWIVFNDDYPEGATTWKLLGDEIEASGELDPADSCDL